ncbi:MAG: DUF3089 domain-containing protein [Solirubrobacterales bacterium]
MVSPSGQVLGVRSPRRPRHRRVDCFYVYPTVSDQQTTNANLHVDPEERSIALYQAARYSQRCRVFAPMYRQVTLSGLGLGGSGGASEVAFEKAYRSLRSAWRTYLARYNRGRGIVFIGHSQGTGMLRRLIAEEVDPKPSLRRRLVSAILLGGNVEVAKGRKIGGDFQHIPACRSATQTGCVVAYSTFDAPVPPDALFGRVGGALSQGDPDKLDVLCTNPAALDGGTARLDTVVPSAPFAPGTTIGIATTLVGMPTVPSAGTPWLEFRGAYDGRCSGAGGAHVLQTEALGGAPALNPIPSAGWGLHLVDANIALGDLAGLVGREAPAYLRG